MCFDEYLDKFNTYYQIFLNETCLFVRKELLRVLEHLLVEMSKEFAECKHSEEFDI